MAMEDVSLVGSVATHRTHRCDKYRMEQGYGS
jgi:hypothetical protein